jgi:hypothetical protein
MLGVELDFALALVMNLEQERQWALVKHWGLVRALGLAALE